MKSTTMMGDALLSRLDSFLLSSLAMVLVTTLIPSISSSQLDDDGLQHESRHESRPAWASTAGAAARRMDDDDRVVKRGVKHYGDVHQSGSFGGQNFDIFSFLTTQTNLAHGAPGQQTSSSTSNNGRQSSSTSGSHQAAVKIGAQNLHPHLPSIPKPPYSYYNNPARSQPAKKKNQSSPGIRNRKKQRGRYRTKMYSRPRIPRPPEDDTYYHDDDERTTDEGLDYWNDDDYYYDDNYYSNDDEQLDDYDVAEDDWLPPGSKNEEDSRKVRTNRPLYRRRRPAWRNGGESRPHFPSASARRRNNAAAEQPSSAIHPASAPIKPQQSPMKWEDVLKQAEQLVAGKDDDGFDTHLDLFDSLFGKQFDELEKLAKPIKPKQTLRSGGPQAIPLGG